MSGNPALERCAPIQMVRQGEGLDEKIAEIEASTGTMVRAAAATHRAVAEWSDEQDRRRKD
jgi:AICAR transformylase/IMP cyclohydrolase PurH